MRKFLCKIKNKYNNLELFAKASIWFLFVTVIDKAIAVITQPVINRILSVDEVGIYNVYNSWYAIFSVIASFNLFGGILEVYLTKNPESKRQVVSSLCSLSILISIIFFGLCFLFINPLSIFLKVKYIYVIFMALAIISETIIQFWVVPKRFEYSYKPYAILVISLFATKCVLSVLLSYFMYQDRVLGRILGLTLPSAIVSIFLLFRIFKDIDFISITKYWKKGLSFNLPLIPHYLASVLLASSDRIMISQLINETDAGLYSVAYSFSSLALIVFSSLNNAYNPFSMKAIKDEHYKELSSVTDSMVLVSVLFALILILLGPEGLLVLGGAEYLTAKSIIPVLVVGIFFSSFYFIFSNVEFVYEKTKFVFPITALGAIINLFLNYIAIPTWGYKTAAYTTLLGYVIISVAHYVISYKIVKRNIYNLKHILIYLCVLIIGAGISYSLYDFYDVFRYIMVLFIAFCAVMYLYKNRSLLTKIKKE